MLGLPKISELYCTYVYERFYSFRALRILWVTVPVTIIFATELETTAFYLTRLRKKYDETKGRLRTKIFTS